MKRRVKQALLSVAASLAMACGSDVQGTAETGSTRTLDFRLVDRDYPFVGEHGEFVCASYELEVGNEIFTDLEFYHLDRIAERLANDIDLGEFVRARGLEQVETCDEARTYMGLKLEFEGQAPPADNSNIPPAPVEEGESIEEEAPVEKIIDGVTSTNPPTVYLRFFGGGTTAFCSGSLIGSREILTSAHCSTFDGLQAVTVQYQNGTCISHSSCGSAPATLSFFERNASYAGSLSVADDVGVLIGPANWTAPANASSKWIRVAESSVALGEDYWHIGYGANTSAGAGGGRAKKDVGASDRCVHQPHLLLRESRG